MLPRELLVQDRIAQLLAATAITIPPGHLTLATYQDLRDYAAGNAIVLPPAPQDHTPQQATLATRTRRKLTLKKDVSLPGLRAHAPRYPVGQPTVTITRCATEPQGERPAQRRGQCRPSRTCFG
jgi:hypothetical protein